MSMCKKFTPNIFSKIKCSNCFRPKEEHSAQALECNRASRSVARSGYLFVAPDWDFSVPLNRTKRWQRRWFVLYDDGELNYSVDEHPDTVPQGSVDMTQVMEVTGAEQVTGHPHSLALTSPDRVTFVKAASREDARWWAELLAVFPRRHKRNATFPGGRASPSLPHLGRSASPQPPRPRHLSCTAGPSPRTNFTTPPLKEEKEPPSKDDADGPGRINWKPDVSSAPVLIQAPSSSLRHDYRVTCGSPPTRDKLRCEDKAREKKDWHNERLRDIATALTDRSPESSLALPSEGLLHLKKGWLWFKDHNNGEWTRLWWVLCGPSLNAYKDQDEQSVPEVSVELSSVTNHSEIQTETRYGFQIQWSGPTLTLSAVTAGIRSNWLQALTKAAPNTESSVSSPIQRSSIFSSDEEYRTASEGGRRDSEDWGDYSSTSITGKLLAGRVRERSRARQKLPRCQSRQSTVDSVSTDELDGFKDTNDSFSRTTVEELRRQLDNTRIEVASLEKEVTRLRSLNTDSIIREQQTKDLLQSLQLSEKDLSQKLKNADEKLVREQALWRRRVSDYERDVRETEERYNKLSLELQSKQKIIASLQEELNCANERLFDIRMENDRLYKKLQELEGKNLNKSKCMTSLTDLTDIDLEIDLMSLNQNELIEQCLDLQSRFEKAVIEIRAIKRELRDSHVKYDSLELDNISLKRSLEMAEKESQSQVALLANRVQDLTTKLAGVEKQSRTLKTKLQDSREKRRSLSLKGRENFSLNKEVEDKVTELEAKILAIERGRIRRKSSKDSPTSSDEKILRRTRRKSLDGATTSEPMKLLMRLTTLEAKVSQANTSNESLNSMSFTESKGDSSETILILAHQKLIECHKAINALKHENKLDKLSSLEAVFSELRGILNLNETEMKVVNVATKSVVMQLEDLLRNKLIALRKERLALEEEGRLDDQAKVEIFAKKIAFENLIIGRIEEAMKHQVSADAGFERILRKEAIETANFLVKLQSKLTNSSLKEEPSPVISIETLTKVLVKRMLYFSRGCKYPTKTPVLNIHPAIEYLEEEHKKVTNLLNVYRVSKLQELAEALALETLNLSTDRSCRLEDDALTDTWIAVRDIVNTELVSSEINHVLMSTAQRYEELSSSDQKNFFTFFAYERASLELWSDAVEKTLKDEMDMYIRELNTLYQSTLLKFENNKSWKRKLDVATNYKSLLSEYADVIAHKALIDARIAVLKGENDATDADCLNDSFVTQLMNLENYWNSIETMNLVNVDIDLEAKFKSMLSKNLSEMSSELLNHKLLETLYDSAVELSNEVNEFGGILVQFKWNVTEAEDKYQDIQGKVQAIVENILRLKSKCNSSLSQMEERQPVYLGTEYLSEVENLRAAYRVMLMECDNHKQQAILEQLQILCERVLVAMEHWHRRSLQDLRESHCRELQILRNEKEQALAEETQATLAALDAMRKAHEAEVEREVAKFKLDYARSQQNEMLELNDRLSVKCLEITALQEQLSNSNRQLLHAQQHIHHLERIPKVYMEN